MHDSGNPATTPPPAPASPWRIVLLDHGNDDDDPKWIICSVLLHSDVRPAELDSAGRYEQWAETTRWVRDQLGHPVELTPMHGVIAWHVREPRS
jgi:hypothetical protein